MSKKDEDARWEAHYRSKETPQETIARIDKEKDAMKSQNQGFIGAMVLFGLFLLLTFGFGCQFDAPYARY